jgi:hypothetical protein
MRLLGLRSIAVKITLLVLVGTAVVFSAILAYSSVYSKQMILEGGRKPDRAGIQGRGKRTAEPGMLP